jgi:FlaA1/EpsC-like NDP-sugar epimerase
MGEGGEIFILDMGSPVKIVDLARDLIRLSGYEPDVDIPIQIIGLRPGEKLFEELITEGEGIAPTRHEKIVVLHADGSTANGGNANGGNACADLLRHIGELTQLANAQDAAAIRQVLQEIVPEYANESGQPLVPQNTPNA